MNLIFLDTETTGLPVTGEKNDHKIIQLAYFVSKTTGIFIQKFNPERKIDLKAMAIHHITDEELTSMPLFSTSLAALRSYFIDHVLICHNAPFDIEMLAAEGIDHIPYCVDTCRVAKHLLPDADSFSLQYLRHYLKLQIEEKLIPHDARSDVILLKEVFFVLFEKVDGVDEKEKLANMINLSTKSVLLKKMSFGKHSGMEFSDIPKGYLRWASNQKDMDPDVLHTVNYHLKK